MSGDVTIGLAFIAGLISFVSPCVLPLVPAYVGYMGGRMTQQVTQPGEGKASGPVLRRRFGTFTHGVFFVFGFTLFFVLFGLLTTAAVSSLTALGVTEGDVREGIARVGGTAVILFGLHIMGVLNRVFSWLMQQAPRLDKNPYGNVISMGIAVAMIGVVYWLFVESWFMTLLVVLLFTQVFNDALKAGTPGQFWLQVLTRLQTALYVDTRRQGQAQEQQKYGYLGSLFMGVVFSAGWTPCIGPIYGAVLTLASTGGSISEAGTLLTAYSFGLGIPFLLTALALDQAQGMFRRLQRNMRTIEAFSGVFLILVGVLVFTGQLERLAQFGQEGELGDISLNMETCAVAVVEGRVSLDNALNCVRDGTKEEFYVAYAKPQPDSDAESAGVESPALDAVPSLDDGPAPFGVSPGPDSVGSSPGLEAIPDLGAASLDEVPSLDDVASAPESAVDEAVGSVPEGLLVGQRAPDFTATTLEGETVSLSDYRDQPVLVNFWATWCGPCREEMPDFQTIYDVYQSEGFVVLAVNDGEPRDEVASFVDELALTFPVLLDPSSTINEDVFGSAIVGYPTSFLLDENGIIVEYFPGELTGARLINALDELLSSLEHAGRR